MRISFPWCAAKAFVLPLVFSICVLTANAATNKTRTRVCIFAMELQFAAGETVKTFAVPIVDDGVAEQTTSFNVVLSAAGAGTMEGSPFTSTVTILDDDQLVLLTQENTSRAVALDSVTMVREPFSLTNLHNFSSDHRTRVMLFATGIDLLPGEGPSAVMVHLDDPRFNQSFLLEVEDVRKVPGFDSLWQIVVKLPGSPDSEGDFQISLTVHGVNSNKALINIIR